MNFDALITAFESGMTSFLTTPASVVAFVVGAAGVSIITQVLKSLSKVKNDKVITVMFMTVSFLATALDYILTSTDLPPSILGINTFLIMGVAAPVYRFGVKPLQRLLASYQTYREGVKAKAAEYEAINKVSTIEQAVTTEEVKTEDGDIKQTSVNTPVTVPAEKLVEQKANIVYF